MKALDQLLRLRRCDTPLVGVRTPDPAAFVRSAAESLNGSCAVVAWDSVRGLFGVNEAGQAALAGIIPPSDIPGVDSAAQTRGPVEALALAEKLPEESLLWALNLHLFISEPLVIQAIANLRDSFKGTGRTLVATGVDMKLPSELAGDVMAIEDPLPNDEELRAIVDEIWLAAFGDEAKSLNKSHALDAVNAVRGLSAFAAEQVLAMSIEPGGFDIDMIWEQKRTTIEQTDGLSFDRTSLTFDDVGGLDNVKRLAKAIISSEKKPALIVRIDEIEKALAGLGSKGGQGDSSGTTQDALGVLLRWMEDDGASGLIAVGPAGSGKTLVSQALGGTGGIPSLNVDLGAAKGSLVGESERKIREIVRTIKGLAGGRQVFVVATCNKLDVLPPELRRRFKLGVVFFDLPNEEERLAIWGLNLERFGIEDDASLPDDEGWTGAEIRNCCELADQLSISTNDAATYLVPVSKADAEGVEALRRAAHGRFLSATEQGTYRMPAETTTTKAGRRLALGEG